VLRHAERNVCLQFCQLLALGGIPLATFERGESLLGRSGDLGCAR
jgi:hypothetical protein